MRVIRSIVSLTAWSLVLSSATPGQNAKDAAYYCTAEAAGGLAYNEIIKKWQGVAFPAEHKFILRMKFLRTYIHKKESEIQEDEAFNLYEVTITGTGKNFPHECERYSGNKEVAVGKYNTVVRTAVLIDYKFNLDRNRYLGTYAVGYAVGLGDDDEHSDTPAIEDGTCTKIE